MEMKKQKKQKKQKKHMTVAEMIHRLVGNALKDRRFFPEFQERTGAMEDISRNKKNITIRGFCGRKNKSVSE